MESALRGRLHDLTLAARRLLIEETTQALEGVYGLHGDGHFEPAERLPAIQTLPEAAETRARLERLLTDERAAGLAPREATEKLTKEVAYTWLNRVAAFKMLEARTLVRQSVSRGADSSGFKLWLTEPGHEEEYARYEQGSLPQGALGEGPRDAAYRHYLLALCERMAAQVHALFDPDTLASRLCPRPRALADLLALVNAEAVAAAWNEEETIGWIYQSFNSEELEAAFRDARLAGKKFEAADIPAVTQLFTPRFVVRQLVENTLGRLWLQMHPDSRLQESLAYLIPTVDAPAAPLKLAREITLLDPACGTMHFGLVAFDLFAAMYAEELERAGEPGWPEQPSVRAVEEIPAAIVAHNLFGIDIDLRAVQLSALTLYLKAASLNPNASIRQSNLACADVLLLNGSRLDDFLTEMRFERPIYERIIRAVWKRLRDANQLGSLLRLDEEIRGYILAERERYRTEREGRLPFEEYLAEFEAQGAEEEYWTILEAQIVQAFDEFAKRQARAGLDQSYFAGEATKGMRLLDVMLRRYDLVVTNPPYMSNRKMNNKLKALVSEDYPAGKGDLYAAFIQRCLEFTAQSGRVGMLTMHSFMFISSYEELRSSIRRQAVIESLYHHGPALFDVGNPGTLQTVAFVLRAEPDATRRDASVGMYIRLVREPDADAKRRGFERAVAHLHARELTPAVYRYRQGDFDAIPGAPWVYWITPGLRSLFQSLPKLEEVAATRHGLATLDNFRFVRYWWEVGKQSIGFHFNTRKQASHTELTWFPYMKSGGFRRWYGRQENIVNWWHDGKEMRPFIASKNQPVAAEQWYFLRGVTYSYLTSNSFSARLSPGGFIFDVAGSSTFPDDLPLILAVLNSSFATFALKLINPTVNFQSGDLARLPVPAHDSDTLGALVFRAIGLSRADSAEDETTYEFVAPPAWPDGSARVASRRAELARVERAIDEEVYRLYGISADDRAAIEAELDLTPSPSPTGEGSADEVDGAEVVNDAGPATDALAATDAAEQRGALARRWVSYAVGIVLGRFAPGIAGALGNGIAPLAAPEGTPPAEGVAWQSIADDAMAAQLRALAVGDGIAPLEPGHPDDLAGRVTRALGLLVGDDQVEALLMAATGGKPLADWLAGDFFKEHIKQYRKRPIYWLLQSSGRGAKRRYSAYLFSERVTRDTLHLLRGGRYVAGRINRLRDETAALRERIAQLPQGADRRRAERDAEAHEAELADLEAFDKALAEVTTRPNQRGETVGWAPELDDGILINLAPLAALLPAWSAEPKQCWEALAKGDYDWSHTAMRYWPERVTAACRANQSYAIAHGLTVEARA